MAILRVTRGGSNTFFGTGTFHIEGIAIHFNVQKTWTAATVAASIRNSINSRQTGMICQIDQTDPSGQTLKLTCRYPGWIGNYIRITYVGCFGRSELNSRNVIIARQCVKIVQNVNERLR